MNNTESTPAGYRTNAQGHLVPESQIRPLDKLRDEVVMNIIEAARQQRQLLVEFKLGSMQKITDLIDLSSSEYGVEFGGTKGNVSLVSFDGRYKLVRAVGEHRVFDERIQAAKKLIDDCIGEWSGGADEKIMALVDHAFRVNKQGKIDINQVLGLRQLDINDAKWNEAMNAIADAIQVTGTSQYLRMYERQSDGSYKQLSLDLAKL
ncbi:TPA: DUF3164 family protein [Citrobacter freundii]|uniref:Sulfate transporter n=1 Tax=uncultured Citrobacter sp. TaxID=200446 RepID=A0A212IMM3_9ENTR|nr:DUF3164 family protein [Citrobacter freundii]MBJ9533195.1 DUF3164 family protein [Citrobacter freundii]NUN37143.1 DUF3164 family protein [Citrobacter freundii]SBV66199.1 conserved hypothetical protein [uncultured Citrobacter sp.]SBV67841.1 conserved hypothetical protein [uncultured Citrobacter sp.]HAT7555792.1 DUF3164 family protein [Citrobacter freundii]